ncbi:hypothetical protein CHS0354_023618 [Potamilus streckersoni]|uniref:Uncharacterized protein n=1 Tax=Potamilus streckersoni TaxID=2493646 RepID=A0AAE0VUJ2_9BIVA|nr:hypothetical protein CHS0354_023618 [Potamilus streckersoni]
MYDIHKRQVEGTTCRFSNFWYTDHRRAEECDYGPGCCSARPQGIYPRLPPPPVGPGPQVCEIHLGYPWKECGTIENLNY